MRKYTYPYTIENGHGELITFIRLVEDPAGNWLEVENTVQPGSGPPMHVHHRQEESLTVVKGKIGVQIQGQPEKFYGPGETATFKAGIPHRFWSAGTEPLICKGYIKPPDNIIYFLGEIFRSTKENGGKPGLFDTAYLMSRYSSEFDMVEIPTFVKKAIFPIIILVGKISGRYNKYSDAPEAVK